MKKVLTAMIIILFALILAMVMFVLGVQLTSEKILSDDDNKADITTPFADNKKTDAKENNKDKQSAAPIDPDYDPFDEKTDTKYEKKPDPESKSEKEPEEKKDTPTTYADYSQGSNEWYRVRTSAGSDGKQDGAFKSFANAKSHADSLKAQGYKVYDNNMKCIYTP